MGKKREIDRPYCNGEWTQARFNSFIASALRGASRRWAPKTKCKRDARVARNTYQCAQCGNLVGNKECAVDHTEPVIDPEIGFTDWDDYIKRMFCELDGLKLLCHDCHNAKTASEKERAKQRKAK